MYYVVKIGEEYLSPPKNENYDAEIKSWTRDIDEARIGTSKEMSQLARRVLRSGSIEIVKVRIFEI